MLSMVALQVPVTGLYFIACGISIFNDRRKKRADPDAELDDDEASDLDLTPSTVEPAAETVSASGGDDGGAAPRNGYDDAT
jgi:sec-independent protein translocase protein TatC